MIHSGHNSTIYIRNSSLDHDSGKQMDVFSREVKRDEGTRAASGAGGTFGRRAASGFAGCRK